MENNKCKCKECQCAKDKALSKAKELYSKKVSKGTTVHKLMPNGNIIK